jgi:hypothetical protein
MDLIQTHFDFPYKLNVGISIANENVSSKKIVEKFYNYNKPNYKIKDIRCKGNEFVTLDLLEEDRNSFSDSDYIFYFHTKGASKMDRPNYQCLVDWRHLMQFFNIEKVNNVFNIFNRGNYNTYGVNFTEKPNEHYSGNFWWAKAEYIKTLDFIEVRKFNRYDAEGNYLKRGINWKPFSPFNSNVNHYNTPFPKEIYRK